jgi:SulP family sulfate permease
MNTLLKELPKSLLSGLIIGTMCSIFSIAFTGLIFNGPTLKYLTIGTSSCLIGTMILSFALSLFSSSKKAIGLTQDVFAVLGAIVCYKISSTLAGTSEEILATIIATLMIMTIGSGCFMLLLGQLRLGNLTRYIPYPVIGGFLAGTGCLLFCHSMTFLTSLTMDFASIPQLFTSAMVWKWALPLAYAVLMIWITKRSHHYATLPTLLVGAILIFYLYLFVSPFSFADLLSNGWMMGPFPEGNLMAIPSLNALPQNIHWDLIAKCAADFIALFALSTISLLLNSSSFEIMSNESIDINRELRVTGLANLMAGLFGGLGGYLGLAPSKINLNLKLNTRMVGVTTGSLIAVMLVIGTSIFDYLPKCIFGALLLYIAFDFINEWLIDIKKKVSWPDYLIVLCITLTITCCGFFLGLLVGFILSFLLFVIYYSRVEVIRNIITGDLIRSNVERTEEEKAILAEKACQILIPVVSGYLFFGNTAFIMNKIIAEVDNRQDCPIRFIVLDFSRVTGIEVSSLMSFVKLMQKCSLRGVHLAFASLPEKISQEIKRFTHTPSSELIYLEFNELNYAIEWCEDRIIHNGNQIKPADEFQFLSATPEENQLLLSYFKRVEVQGGTILYKEGEPSQDLFYLSKGSLDVFISYNSEHQTRLAKINPGAVVGEMGLFLSAPRSATVIASADCVLHQLTDKALKKLYLDSPQLGIIFDQLVIQLLGKRIIQANKFTNYIKTSL